MRTPFKIRILHGRDWYKQWKNRTLRVVDTGKSYVLYVDFKLGYDAFWRHVEKRDAEIVEEGA